VAAIYGEGSAAVIGAVSDQLQLMFSLRPALRDYAHNDGSIHRLACLSGTVPTRPKTLDAAVYRIPVDVWLPARFPTEAPIVYVIATSTVGVRPSPIVDSTGRVAVKLPYFFWDPDEPHPAVAAVDLIEAVCAAFATAVPVERRMQDNSAPRPWGGSPNLLFSHHALSRAVKKKVAAKRRELEASRELPRLRETGGQLMAGQQQLAGMLSRGAAEIAAAQAAVARFTEGATELDSKLAAAAHLVDLPVGKLATTNTPLYEQMLRWISEIAASEDVLISLNQGLRTGAVKLPQFLRLTRGVLLKQFNARAHLLRARDVAKTAFQ